MNDLWNGLPAMAQDSLMFLALLLPIAVLAFVILRGFAPLPLVRAMLWRFRGTSLLFGLLIAVSVGTGIGLVAQERALRQGSARAADKFDLVVAAPGNEITMLLASVFLEPSDVSLLDGARFHAVASHPGVDFAAPIAFGDSVGDAPVIGTTADFANHLSDGHIEGRLWQARGEALVGAATGIAIGAELEPAHGVGAEAEEGAHGEEHFEVVGRLPRSGTPWDHAILVPVETVWGVHGLADGHSTANADRLGPPFDLDYFPGTPAIMVRAESLAATYGLRSEFNADPGMMAFFPGTVLAQLYAIMGDVRQAMSILALVSQALVAASVLLGLFILSRLIRRQMAVLRALGAPMRFIFAVVWCYGTTLLLAGAALGLGVGYGAAAGLSRLITAQTNTSVVASIGWSEIHLVAAFISLASLAALLPAAAALRQPVIDGLRA